MDFNCKENINMAPFCSMKVGGNVTELTNGAKYAFGYKFANYAAYAASIGANANDDLKFGVNLTALGADYTGKLSYLIHITAFHFYLPSQVK